MYQELENILVRTLSPFEYEKLEELKQTYSEKQIIDAYKEQSYWQNKNQRQDYLKKIEKLEAKISDLENQNK